MKLDDFLKCKKVRCLSNDYDFNEQGKAYKLHGLRVFITDEAGCTAFLPIEDFEPVLDLDQAENPLQNIELTPEFEAVEPKFKVGDKVYLFGTNYTEEITKIIGANVYLAGADFDASVSVKEICHATPENHALLSKLYPHIEFEQPPKPLSGDELVRAMLKKGIKNVLCLRGSGDKIIIDRLDYKGSLMNTNCHIVGGLTPIDWCTGEPLTQAVLDE